VGGVRLPTLRLLLPVAACAAALAAPSLASAEVTRTVRPGETLWSIANANGLLTSALAAYNGVSVDHQVVLGSEIRIPTTAEALRVVEGAAAPSSAVVAPAATAGGAPEPLGGYTVRRGDTLSGLAAQSGVPVSAIAAMNGLDPDAFLLAGTVLKLPTGAPAPAATSEPAPAAKVVPQASPDPTPVRLSASQVTGIAAQHGVPASLAAAIAWQESGFNNAMVSSANARGVMQVMPGTWDYVQQNLTSQPLNPDSAEDNVRAGSLYLARLLRDAGGDERLATAAYYQGLASVRRIGLLPETQRYVDNVMALRSRFGG
jgi:soluble lytic murein transglycosylase-like protein